jgi:hypothetical protein
MSCLLCHYEPNQPERGDHLPGIESTASGIYVCVECNARAKTVAAFGLTVNEMKLAALALKHDKAAVLEIVKAAQAAGKGGAT